MAIIQTSGRKARMDREAKKPGMRGDEQIVALQEFGESRLVQKVAVVFLLITLFAAASQSGRKVPIDIRVVEDSKNGPFFGECTDPLTCCN